MNIDQKKGRGRPRKAAADRDAERRAFAEAAFAIVREGGSSALTARSLAARTGAAMGTVYSAYSDLDALRLDVNAITMGLLKDHLAGALSRREGEGLETRLLFLAEAYADFARRDRAIWSALFEARAAPAPPAAAAHVSELFALLADLLRGASDLGAEEAVILARALWSSVHGAVFLAEAGGLGPIGRDEVPAMIAALVRTVVAGLPRRAV